MVSWIFLPRVEGQAFGKLTGSFFANVGARPKLPPSEALLFVSSRERVWRASVAGRCIGERGLRARASVPPSLRD